MKTRICLFLFCFSLGITQAQQLSKTAQQSSIESIERGLNVLMQYSNPPDTIFISSELPLSEQKSIKKLNDSIRFVQRHYARERIMRTKSLVYEKSRYKYFNNYKDSLIKALWNDSTDTNAIIILSCLELNKKEKEAIRSYSATPKKVKARLGDKVAEKELLVEFQQYMDNQLEETVSKEKPLDTILFIPLFINTKRSLEVFFKYMEQGDTTSSDWENFIIRVKTYTNYKLYACLRALEEYYSEHMVFRLNFYETHPMYHLGIHSNLTKNEWKDIFLQIEKEIALLFNIQVNINAPYLYRFQYNSGYTEEIFDEQKGAQIDIDNYIYQSIEKRRKTDPIKNKKELKEYVINDLTNPLCDTLKYDNVGKVIGFEIKIVGEIDGEAVMEYEKKSGGYYQLYLRGKVSYTIEDDWDKSTIIFKYTPTTTIQGGSLILKYRMY